MYYPYMDRIIEWTRKRTLPETEYYKNVYILYSFIYFELELFSP